LRIPLEVRNSKLLKLKGKKEKKSKFSIQTQRRASADDSQSLLFTRIFLLEKIIIYVESKKIKLKEKIKRKRKK
jgi:hypothetical protein